MGILGLGALSGSSALTSTGKTSAPDSNLFSRVLAATLNPGATAPAIKADATATETAATPGAERARLRTEVERLQGELRAALNSLFEAQGVDTTQPISLQDNDFGGVDVAGDHPDRDLIEQILGENPELIVAFQDLKTQAEQLRSTDATLPFATAAPAADSRFSDLFPDAGPRTFTFILREGAGQLAFV